MTKDEVIYRVRAYIIKDCNAMMKTRMISSDYLPTGRNGH